MIVVANARPFVGQKTEIELVSMIQGASGRMFFAEVVKDKDPAASGPAGEHDRGYRGQERRRS